MTPIKLFWLCLFSVLSAFTYKIYDTNKDDIISPIVAYADSGVILDTHIPDSVLPDVEAQVIPKPKTNDNIPNNIIDTNNNTSDNSNSKQ